MVQYVIEYKLPGGDWTRLPEVYDYCPFPEFDEYRFKWFQQCKIVKIETTDYVTHEPEINRVRK